MKLRFGIEKLDEILGGGLDEDTVNLIIGKSGVGKTILASHWAAEGARNGETVVYLATTFGRRSCETYLGQMSYMKDAFDKINWRFVRIEPKYLLPMTYEKIKESAETTFKINLKDIDRLVFDTVTDMDKALNDPVLYRQAIRFTSRFCYENDITALFVEEAQNRWEWSEAKNLAECVIFLDFLRVPEGYVRALRILKKYRSSHPLYYIPFEITQDGIVIREGKYVRKDYDYIHRE